MKPYCRTNNLPSKCKKVRGSEIKESDLFYARDVTEIGNKYFLVIAERSDDKGVYGNMVHSACKHWKNHYVSPYGASLWDKMGDGTPYYEFYRLDGYGSYYYRGGKGYFWIDDDDRCLRFGD